MGHASPKLTSSYVPREKIVCVCACSYVIPATVARRCQKLIEEGTKVTGIIGLFGFHAQPIATCQQRRDRQILSLQEHYSSVSGPPAKQFSCRSFLCGKWHARLEPPLPAMKMHGSDFGRCGINYVDVPRAAEKRSMQQN